MSIINVSITSSLKGGINTMNIQVKKEGFTIIEVVLVLAIAGLIFLMVFIALPALQRNQRDTARKSDVSNIAAAVTAYSSNNRGAFPDTAALAEYVKDVSDNTTKVLVNVAGDDSLAAGTGTATGTTTEATVQDGLIVVTQRTKCGASGTTQALSTGSNREFTVVTRIETGNGVAFCQNS
ncbi:type II secretion system protein [Candidatus Saccharibacteria bacterium]|nr:type II secretion system protein [Candidatus Saccharibacteria bacterium]